MTLLRGESDREIPASLARCWAVVADVERWPQWQPSLEPVTVVERDDEGRASVCEIVFDARVTTVRCRVAIAYEPPSRFSFARIASDAVDALEGAWELSARGADRTHATFRMAVDPGPVGLLARPLERALRPVVVGRRPDELAREVARRG